jgi:osmotically-inducible protein OsmY
MSIRPNPGSYAESQNYRIRSDVQRQLKWQSDIGSDEIKVQVDGPIVTLSGRVETHLEKHEAENAAKAVYGVSSVNNNIEVIPRQVRTDREIETDINSGLRHLSYVLEELPTVHVSGGIVTLRGKVRWNFQRDSASHAAEAVPGVRQVNNLIWITTLQSMPTCRISAKRRIDATPSSVRSEDSRQAGRPIFFLPHQVN